MNDSSIKIPMSQYRELLVKYLAPQRRSVSVLATLLFIDLVLQLVNPQILRSFIDSIQAGTTMGRLIALAALFTGIALVHQLVSVAEVYIGGLVSWTATNSLRNDLARHALSLDGSYHNSRTPGEMIERVDGDSDTLGGFLSTFALQMVGSGLLLIGILGLLFREDWRAGLVLTAFAAVSAAILVRLRNFSAGNWKSGFRARKTFVQAASRYISLMNSLVNAAPALTSVEEYRMPSSSKRCSNV